MQPFARSSRSTAPIRRLLATSSPGGRERPLTPRYFAALLPTLALAFACGCGASAPGEPPRAPSADMAPPAPAPPPPVQAAPAQPAPPAGPMARGYAPPAAPPDPSPREPSAEALAVPPQAAPAPAAPSPGAPGPAPAAARAAGKGPVAARTPPPPPAKAPPPPPKPKPLPPPPKPAERSAKAPPGQNAPQGVPAAPMAPLLIYVGDMQMQVDEADFAPTLDKVIDIAEALGGYLAGRKDTSVQVRIPSARFRESLVQIEKVGLVIHRSVTADDVSEQYSDLEGRLVNLKATRHRLQEFLARSGTMADMLQVGRELERVAAEIEQIEGKMRYLRSRAAFSLVTVSLVAKPKVINKVADNPPPPPPPREADLPIDWLVRVNLGRLLNLRDR